MCYVDGTLSTEKHSCMTKNGKINLQVRHQFEFLSRDTTNDLGSLFYLNNRGFNNKFRNCHDSFVIPMKS